MNSERKKVWGFLFLFLLLISIDQASKYGIRHWGGTYSCNRGIAFGISLYPVLFWFFWLGIILGIIGLLVKKSYWRMEIGIWLILAGAMANMIDRIVRGCVIDFIDLRFWPVFNLADSIIVLGAAILLVKWSKIWYHDENHP